MRNKKIVLAIALVAVITVAATLLTACNTEEQVYAQIFELCAKQNNLAVTVKSGEYTVYTYKDGAGSSDYVGIDVDAQKYVQAAENAGKKLSISDFAEGVNASYEEVTGAFEIQGALADAKAVLGLDVQANVHIKGNFLSGNVEIYQVAYQHNGFDVTITLV